MSNSQDIVMTPIEKGRRIPPVCATRGRAAIYPFASMQQGDCFFVPGKTTQRFGPTVHYWTKKLQGMRFVSRAYDEEGKPYAKNGVQGIYVFRLE